MSLACRVHWSWVDRTGQVTQSNKVKGAWRAQHPKCSDKNVAAPRRAGTSFGFIFLFVSFHSASCLSLGDLVQRLSGPAGRRASAMTFSRCDTSPTVDCCSFSICRTQSPEELGRVGERSLWSGWTARLSCGDTDFFFFFFLKLTRRRGLGERGDKILRWRHSNCTHYDACRRETAWVFPETFRSASRKTEQPRFRLRAYRTVQTRPVSSRSVHHGIFPDVYFYTHPSAAARTAPNGVKERASFCLVFS